MISDMVKVSCSVFVLTPYAHVSVREPQRVGSSCTQGLLAFSPRITGQNGARDRAPVLVAEIDRER